MRLFQHNINKYQVNKIRSVQKQNSSQYEANDDMRDKLWELFFLFRIILQIQTY